MPKQSALAQYKALILAGGLGTRLQSTYSDGPKAMAPIHGVPFLAYLLKQLADSGFEDVVLCIGHAYKKITDWFGDGSFMNLRLHYSVEQELLGTGGALRLGATRYASGCRVFAMNGDTLHRTDYSAMLDFHEKRRADCTIGLADVPDASRYGSVDIARDGKVTAFREKISSPGRAYVNSGIYVLEATVLEAIPAGRPVSMEKEVLPNVLKASLMGFPSEGYFIDIGVREDYFRAQRELRPMEIK